MPIRGRRNVRAQRRNDILACAPDIILKHRGFDTFGQIAVRLGCSADCLRHHVSNEGELIRLLCLQHLQEAFETVCRQSDRGKSPRDVVHAMGLALLRSIDENAPRHHVYLLHRQELGEDAGPAVEARLAFLINAFQCAFYDMDPEKPFAGMREPARLLVGQLFHAPLWAGPAGVRDSWLCNQIGFLAGCAEREKAKTLLF